MNALSLNVLPNNELDNVRDLSNADLLKSDAWRLMRDDIIITISTVFHQRKSRVVYSCPEIQL